MGAGGSKTKSYTETHPSFCVSWIKCRDSRADESCWKGGVISFSRRRESFLVRTLPSSFNPYAQRKTIYVPAVCMQVRHMQS